MQSIGRRCATRRDIFKNIYLKCLQVDIFQKFSHSKITHYTVALEPLMKVICSDIDDLSIMTSFVCKLSLGVKTAKRRALCKIGTLW